MVPILMSVSWCCVLISRGVAFFITIDPCSSYMGLEQTSLPQLIPKDNFHQAQIFFLAEGRLME